MKTKKNGVYIAFAAALLLAPVLIISCMDPISPGGLQVPNDNTESLPPPPQAWRMLS
jgi:hypothetical protein